MHLSERVASPSVAASLYLKTHMLFPNESGVGSCTTYVHVFLNVARSKHTFCRTQGFGRMQTQRVWYFYTATLATS